MKVAGKLFVVLLVAVIAVFLLNAFVNLDTGSLFSPSADTQDSVAPVSPTLRAPVQELNGDTLPDRNFTVMVSLIGLIGILLIVVNYMRWKR